MLMPADIVSMRMAGLGGRLLLSSNRLATLMKKKKTAARLTISTGGDDDADPSDLATGLKSRS